MANTVIYQKRGTEKVKVAETPDLSPYAIKADVDAELATKADAEDLGITDKRVDNLSALLNGALSTQQTDATSAYSKIIPAKAQPYAAVQKIGGRSVAWNQIIYNGDFSLGTTSWGYPSGITMTVADNVATMTVAADGDNYAQQAYPGVVGHKYLLLMDVWSDTADISPTRVYYGGAADTSYYTIQAANTWETFAVVFECETNQYNFVRLRNPKATTTTKYRNIHLHDLTLMFGAGNEPATVDAFRAMFPASYYAYNAGTLKSAGVTSIVSKDAEDATLASLPIPAAVQALPGYGWSAGDVCNEVDFERKVYIQRVASVDMGTLGWGDSEIPISNVNVPIFRTEINALPNMKRHGQGICSKILVANGGTYSLCYQFIGNNDPSMWIGTTYWSADALRIIVKASAYTDAATFKTAMSGVYLYYELATQVETDISSLLSDDNLIAVEPGGTISFPSQLGDDYRIPVPSTEEYTIDMAPDTPTTDGTYTLQCTVADGVASYEWVSAE